jgi:hypothetical protein
MPCYYALSMGEKQIHKSGNLTFIFINNSVIVQTNLGQRFILQPYRHHLSSRINNIRDQIMLDRIGGLNDLAELCGGCVQWVTTYREADFTLESQQVVA